MMKTKVWMKLDDIWQLRSYISVGARSLVCKVPGAKGLEFSLKSILGHMFFMLFFDFHESRV